MASDALIFDDSASVLDLANLITRAKAVHEDAALFTARGQALAVYVPVLVPAELGAGDYTVLAMRVHRLAEPAELNAAYELSAIQDRLARMGEESTRFVVPPVEAVPAWAGIQVPVSGWEAAGALQNAELAQAAQRGIDAVAQALPENPGKPVIGQVRQRIWSSPLAAEHQELPLGAAFALHALGLLPATGQSSVLRQGSWMRVSNERGHVLVRRAPALSLS
ncbi:hypothetical protein GCM10027417_06820 [Glutamicibacter endophyticus]|uniref:hypothetical protein n=1 Tax=Glutamicibacter sp. PS TaxID=3075634 RepID=UPI00283AC31B|nr:hypothetical protein [Glutamicibacter sp. PS]MDR4532591.1 hypothetical protein [Glutamicibacter sp. PS]